MKRLSLLLLSIAVLGVSGCKGRLTEGAVRSSIEERVVPQVRNTTVGEITILLGEAQSTSPDDGCAQDSSYPYEVLEAAKFAQPGIVTIDRVKPCQWNVRLNDSLRSDLEDYQRKEDDGQVSLKLGRYKDFEIKKLSKSGSSGTAAVVLNFPFTETMNRLATVLYYPELDEKGCKYDLPGKRFQCSIILPLSYFDGRWQVGNPNLAPS